VIAPSNSMAMSGLGREKSLVGALLSIRIVYLLRMGVVTNINLYLRLTKCNPECSLGDVNPTELYLGYV